MKVWQVLIWAVLSAFFFVLVVSAGLWLVAAPVTMCGGAVVDGVTVVEECRTDYTQLIMPGLVLAIGALGLTGASLALRRTLTGSSSHQASRPR